MPSGNSALRAALGAGGVHCGGPFTQPGIDPRLLFDRRGEGAELSLPHPRRRVLLVGWAWSTQICQLYNTGPCGWRTAHVLLFSCRCPSFSFLPSFPVSVLDNPPILLADTPHWVSSAPTPGTYPCLQSKDFYLLWPFGPACCHWLLSAVPVPSTSNYFSPGPEISQHRCRSRY